MALLQTTPEFDQKSNDLQIACINVECKCGESILSDGDKLYICKSQQCGLDYYCESCGPYFHRTKAKKNKKDHSFKIESNGVVLLNQWITQLHADKKEFDFGKKQLIQLIGLVRYNKIAPYVEKSVSLTLSNGAMTFQLACELKDFFTTAQKAIEAASAASKAAEAASIAFKNSWMPTWGESLQSLSQKANVISLAKSKEATAALNSTMSIQDAVKSGAIGMLVATGIEMAIHGYRYGKGEISGTEWCRLLGKSICRNTAGLFGTAVGGKFGATVGCKVGTSVGTAICPGVGTFVGGATGIFVGILFGYLMGKGAEATYEYWCPSKEENLKSKVVDEALLYFNFEKKDVTNGDIFNETVLKKKFKQKALFAHPDRRNGDHSAWYTLSQYYGILKGLLEQEDSDKEMVQDTIQSIQHVH